MSGRFIQQRLLGLGFLGCLATVVVPAGAKPMVPGQVQAILDMPCAPPCTICHETMNGGPFTATKTFVLNLLNRGFSVEDLSTLKPALDQLSAFPEDSDGDGMDDVTELKAGLDPNNPSKGASVCGPEYGCLHIGRGRVDAPAAVIAGLALIAGALLLRRRR